MPGLGEPGEELTVSSRPNALVLWYPVVDNGPAGFGPKEMKARYRDISPLHNVTSNAPPTLVLLGTEDKYIPVATGEGFQRRMKEAGVRCELKLFPGAGHPIYDWRWGGSPSRAMALHEAETFLFKPLSL